MTAETTPVPVRCTKCGSHRTQTVGRGDDPAVLVVRCSACGFVFTVSVDTSTEGEA